MIPDLSISRLLKAYREASCSPKEIVLDAWRRAASDDPAIWISRPTEAQLRESLGSLEGESPDSKPLYGIPFAIKDNIDCAGYPTTAACPAWSYEPTQHAFVVKRLIDAGAIPMGKTNLDQFATGLVGVRSPYGVPGNAFNPDYIPGGSSAGSAVAVAKGLCSFSLGTDTAGSGRVPASFNNLIGLKATRGLLSCTGVVPACRTLDCVSIFALTAADASSVLKVADAFDETDAYARRAELKTALSWPPKIGFPRAEQLDFFGNDDARKLFANARQTIADMGWEIIEVDISAFLDAARLLYEGPWVAERTAVVSKLLAERPEAFLPVTRTIIEGGFKGTAVDAFRAQYRLAELRRASEATWQRMDALLMPTAGTIYTRAEVEAEPIKLNSNLGRYTNFMNLLDLCGCAVPAGFLGDGLPWGVTLPLGKSSAMSSTSPLPGSPPATVPMMKIAVCGAHMEGLALHWQLSDRKARFVQRTLSAPCYRLYLLPANGRIPDRPGMVRVCEGGSAIELEVWEIPQSTLGSFLDGIAAPLGLGRVQLADGTTVCGFVCEGLISESALEITSHRSWRKWLED